MSFSLNWRGQYVQSQVEEAKGLSLDRIGLAIEGQAKVNIQGNDQIDTGFMLNSVYYRSPRVSTFAGTMPEGSYQGQKSGKRGKRRKAPEAVIPAGKDAIVGVAASYAIYQELRKSFLFAAAQQVVSKVGGLVQRV